MTGREKEIVKNNQRERERQTKIAKNKQIGRHTKRETDRERVKSKRRTRRN